MIFFILYQVLNLLAVPIRIGQAAFAFLNHDIDADRPISETFASIATESLARESLIDHIEAMRIHLLRMVVALVVGVCISLFFTTSLMEYLAGPVGGLAKLQAIEVTEELGVFMRVALLSGIAMMLPYLVFEVWLFVAPALRPKERKLSLGGIPLATILFLGGMAFTFYYFLPTALPFLGGFTNISEFWTAREYFKFVTGMMLWIGLFFEFPLVIFALTYVGFVKPENLRNQWRLAIVIIAIIAAAVTPTVDPVNMGLVMIPMIMLYFISIGLSYLANALRIRKNEIDQTTEEKISAP